MRSSFKILAVRGIDIRLHITFPLILLWGALQFGYLAGNGATGALFGIIFVILLFTLVTLHELGHSFAALHFNVPVKRIVLLPIGGVAQLAEMPRKPYQEFIIAIAGPAVNFAIALLLLAVAPLLGVSLSNPLALLGNISFDATTILGYLFYYNAALAVFNLIPAFPMDGGRVLRSLLAMRMKYGRATNIAVRVGQTLAIAMGIYGLLNGGFFIILIAFFIFNGAQQENRAVGQAERLRTLSVSQAIVREPLVLSPYDNLQRAINLRRLGIQSEFPVVYAGQLIGYVYEETLTHAIAQRPMWTPVRDIMSKQINPVSISSNLDDVQRRMQSEKLTVLPVVSGTQFLGLVSYRSILQAMGVGGGPKPNYA